MSQEPCTICLRPITDPASADCGHTYCFPCIREWCRVSVYCPCCRLRIQKLLYRNRRRKVRSPVVPYEKRINQYLYGDELVRRRLPYALQPDLRNFVVDDSDASDDDYGSGNSDE